MVRTTLAAFIAFMLCASAAVAVDELAGFGFKPGGQLNGTKPVPVPSSASCADPSIKVIGDETGFAIDATNILVCVQGAEVARFNATTFALASSTNIRSADNVTGFVDAADGNVDARINTATAAIAGGISFANGVNTMQSSGNGTMLVGATSDQAATVPIFTVADNLPNVSSSGVSAFEVYAENTMRNAPGDALVTATPTDTTSTPLGSGTTGCGTACQASSTGASAWTPSETGAVSGMYWTVVNTGTNVITMTNSAGVYQGTCALGQYDAVKFEYRVDRHVQTSCENNP